MNRTMIINRTRDSAKFYESLDRMIDNNPNTVYKQKNIECEHRDCKCKVRNGTRFCGNHISYQPINHLIRELVDNQHLHNSGIIQRRISIKKNLFYRYRVHMNAGQRIDFMDMIKSFSSDTSIPIPSETTLPYWSPEKPNPILVKRSYTNVLRQTMRSLVHCMLQNFEGSIPPIREFDDLFYELINWYPNDDFIPLDVQHWMEMQCKMADYLTAYANFIDADIYSLEEGEIKTPVSERDTFRWHIPSDSIYDASMLFLEDFMKVSCDLRSRVVIPLDTSIYIISECPVCCNEIQLGQLPKCTHCLCKECWNKWNLTGNISCPLCREIQR